MRLQVSICYLLRKILRPHAGINRNQHPFRVAPNHPQISAPFIAHPQAICIFHRARHQQHRFGGAKRRINQGFKILAGASLQGYARIKHAITRLRQHMINLLRHFTILGAPAFRIRILKGNKDIVGRLMFLIITILGVNFIDFLGFTLIYHALLGRLLPGQFQRLFIILVIINRIFRHPVEGRQFSATLLFFHIFHAVCAQRQQPISIVIRIAFANQLIKLLHGLIICAILTIMVDNLVLLLAPRIHFGIQIIQPSAAIAHQHSRNTRWYPITAASATALVCITSPILHPAYSLLLILSANPIAFGKYTQCLAACRSRLLFILII